MNVLTTAATHDNLVDADYRDIYDELRSGCSLREFIALAGSTLSASWWSQWEHGEKRLTRRARNDMRRAVGLPQLPPTVEEAIAAHVHPDATVARIGDDTQARRVLVLATSADVTITWNGSGPQMATTPNVTGVHGVLRQNTTYGTGRARRAALSLPVDFHARLNAARLVAGETWPEFLGRLL